MSADVAAVAAVLGEHAVAAKTPGDTACRCDHRWQKDADYRAHVAATLLASPVVAGLVAEGKREAWDEGWDAAWSPLSMHNRDDGPNPYLDTSVRKADQ